MQIRVIQAFGLVVAFVLVAVVGGCNPQLAPPLRTLGGVLILDQRDPVERGGGECRGTGAYEDLRSGVPVVVRNDRDEQVGTGTLRARPAPTSADGTVPLAERRRCVWEFAVPNLGAEAVYSVAIGNRGAVAYTHDELDKAGWTVQISLGS